MQVCFGVREIERREKAMWISSPSHKRTSLLSALASTENPLIFHCFSAEHAAPAKFTLFPHLFPRLQKSLRPPCVLCILYLHLLCLISWIEGYLFMFRDVVISKCCELQSKFVVSSRWFFLVWGRRKCTRQGEGGCFGQGVIEGFVNPLTTIMFVCKLVNWFQFKLQAESFGLWSGRREHTHMESVTRELLHRAACLHLTQECIIYTSMMLVRPLQHV